MHVKNGLSNAAALQFWCHSQQQQQQQEQQCLQQLRQQQQHILLANASELTVSLNSGSRHAGGMQQSSAKEHDVARDTVHAELKWLTL